MTMMAPTLRTWPPDLRDATTRPDLDLAMTEYALACLQARRTGMWM